MQKMGIEPIVSMRMLRYRSKLGIEPIAFMGMLH